jgi:hypothetical protein
MVGQKKYSWWERFPNHEIRKIDGVGEDSEPKKMCSELAGTHFMIRKIKFQ